MSHASVVNPDSVVPCNVYQKESNKTCLFSVVGKVSTLEQHVMELQRSADDAQESSSKELT